MSDIVIKFDSVSKSYNIHERGYRSFREDLTRFFKRFSLRSRKDPITNNILSSSDNNTFWALKDVSFEVKKGEALGIIGANGSGKTTILRLLSKVTAPTKGAINTYGKIAPLIQVGAGFNPELTGKENIYLNATIMGLKKREIDAKYDDIVSFAELSGFMDTPVKRYSSGMYVRLGFAVVANIDPDIFLIDEILSVGDLSFQRKCLDTMGRIRRTEKAIIFVSHNLSAVRGLCDRVVWLNKGQIEEEGNPDVVINAYVKYMTSKSTFINDVKYCGGTTRWGTGEARFTKVEVLNAKGVRVNRFLPGDKIIVRLEYEANKKIDSPTFWVGLMNKDGIEIFGTLYNKNRVGEYSINDKGSLSCVIDSVPMRPGAYYVMVGIYGEFGDLAIDRIGRAAEFEIEPMHGNEYENYNGYGGEGAVNLSHQWNHFDNNKT